MPRILSCKQPSHALRLIGALANKTMHKIHLPSKDLGDHYLNQSVKTLSKGINLNRAKDVDRACEFSILLYSAEFADDAMSLLKSFVYDIEYSERSGAWSGKEVGLSLIAYYYLINKQISVARDAVSEIFSSNPNFDINDIDWVLPRLEDEISDYTPRSEWPEEVRMNKQNAILGHSSCIAYMIFSFIVSKVILGDSSGITMKAEVIIKNELAGLKEIFNSE